VDISAIAVTELLGKMLKNPMMQTDILKFQQECFINYLKDIRQQVSEFPNEYVFPYGNPILPILPVKTAIKKIMFVGAFPSARFEFRNGILIPTANNLSPFGKEEYFDGQQIRTQASREVLEKNYFSQLEINADEHWITDLVKIYLMPQKHIRNCISINPNLQYTDTHKLFEKIAIASLNWFYKELKVCNPKLIITFGEIVARVIKNDQKTQNDNLLNGEIHFIEIEGIKYKICCLPHPEIVRRNKNWCVKNSNIITFLNKEIKNVLS
jgi:hypothetical protein